MKFGNLFSYCQSTFIKVTLLIFLTGFLLDIPFTLIPMDAFANWQFFSYIYAQGCLTFYFVLLTVEICGVRVCVCMRVYVRACMSDFSAMVATETQVKIDWLMCSFIKFSLVSIQIIGSTGIFPYLFLQFNLVYPLLILYLPFSPVSFWPSSFLQIVPILLSFYS